MTPGRPTLRIAERVVWPIPGGRVLMRSKACPAALAVLALVFTAAPVAAQATNPPYLAEFPTVDKVKQTMTDADPRERALKQIGALSQLQEVIKQLGGPREFRGLLPDEARLVQLYATASFYIAKAIDSAIPGPYGRWQKVSQNTPYGYMR